MGRVGDQTHPHQWGGTKGRREDRARPQEEPAGPVEVGRGSLARRAGTRTLHPEVTA